MPYAGLADHVFRTYHWTEQQWGETSSWLWDEIQEFWKARTFVQRQKSRAPEPTNTKDLMAMARQQGFDVPDEWENQIADSG
jgi:hypothetical protein